MKMSIPQSCPSCGHTEFRRYLLDIVAPTESGKLRQIRMNHFRLWCDKCGGVVV
jgi:predicted nucleic-acid-binding Zn-ribbon protein